MGRESATRSCISANNVPDRAGCHDSMSAMRPISTLCRKKEPVVGGGLALAARGVATANRSSIRVPPSTAWPLMVRGPRLRFKHVRRRTGRQGRTAERFHDRMARTRSFTSPRPRSRAIPVVSSDQVSRPVAVRFGWAASRGESGTGKVCRPRHSAPTRSPSPLRTPSKARCCPVVVSGQMLPVPHGE